MQLDRSDFKHLANAMSKAFRDSHGGGIVERFEAVSKLLFIKVVDERMAAGGWLGMVADRLALEWRDQDVSRTVYERAQGLWVAATGGKRARVLKGDRSFPKDVEAVAKCVRLLQDYQLDELGVDIKGAVYEELLRNTFEKNDNQQYFTPRHLMEFIVAMTAPTADSLVCDPAAGSGGFLVGALAYVDQLSDSGRALPEAWGIDIDERMAWIARINVFLHGGDPAAIIHLPGAGALKPLSQIQRSLPDGGFTHILTNPPFGSDMTDAAALRGFKTGRGRGTRRRGVLFIERCLELLKPGGVLAVVIDDSILNLQGNKDIREILRRDSRINAVISLPDVTFMPYSTAKSSIVIVSKPLADDAGIQGPVFMADVEQVGNRPNGDPLYQDVPAIDGARPLLSDLPEVLQAWEYFQAKGVIPAGCDESKIFLADINAYRDEHSGGRLDVNYHHPTRVMAAQALETATVPTYSLDQLFDFDQSLVNVRAEYGDAGVQWLGLGDIKAQTGEYMTTTVPADRIKSTAHRFQAGDILMSKLRPKLRKVVYIPADSSEGVCSAELVVLRPKSAPATPVLPSYVAYMLRSNLAYGQQVFQITGVGRPRVGMQALRDLRLPVPAFEKQEAIVAEFESAFENHLKLRRRAESLMSQADAELQTAYSSASVALVRPYSSETSVSRRENSSGSLAKASS